MVFAAALVASASAHFNGSVAYTTVTVDSYTTFCPSATQITHAEKTYTVTEATLLTITNCPCTLTKPVSVAPVTSVPVKSVAPVVPVSSVAPIVVSSAAPVTSVAPVKTVAPIVVSSAPVVVSSAPAVVVSSAPVAPIYANSTTPVVVSVGTSAPSNPVSPATPSTSAFKGAANHMAASGFGLAGVLAIAAYLL